jgi:nicotinate phosphoribosyltransferase
MASATSSGRSSRSDIFSLPFDADMLATTQVCLASKHGVARSTFECSFSSLAEGAGFVVFAGLENLVETLERLKLRPQDGEWLVLSGIWSQETLDKVGTFDLRCDIDAALEGTCVFPGEPILTVEGPLWQAQLIANLAARMIGEASSIATRFTRIALATERRSELVDVGSSRETDTARAAFLARAAVIGGASATSSCGAARALGIPLRPRQVPGGLLALKDRVEAHRLWLAESPNGSLVYFDPSQPEQSAQKLALAAEGLEDSWETKSFGVEIGAGNYVELASGVHRAFAARGLQLPGLYLSGLLDEYSVRELRREVPLAGLCVDAQRLPPVVSVRSELVAIEESGRWSPRMRYADSLVASSDPGRKLMVRYVDAAGHPVADVAHAANERMKPARDLQFIERGSGARLSLTAHRGVPLFTNVMREGKRSIAHEPLTVVSGRAVKEIAQLGEREKRLTQPARYPVGMTDSLFELKMKLLAEIDGRPSRGSKP